jgi:hypothetical protein
MVDTSNKVKSFCLSQSHRAHGGFFYYIKALQVLHSVAFVISSERSQAGVRQSLLFLLITQDFHAACAAMHYVKLVTIRRHGQILRPIPA